MKRYFVFIDDTQLIAQDHWKASVCSALFNKPNTSTNIAAQTHVQEIMCNNGSLALMSQLVVAFTLDNGVNKN